MKKIFLSLGLACGLFAASEVSANTAAVAPFADNDIIGRWDLTVNMDGRMAPSWLEVKLSGVKTLVGYFGLTAGGIVTGKQIGRAHV